MTTIIPVIIHQEAEEKSAHVCENCGKEGEANSEGWISVRCEECRR